MRTPIPHGTPRRRCREARGPQFPDFLVMSDALYPNLLCHLTIHSHYRSDLFLCEKAKSEASGGHVLLPVVQDEFVWLSRLLREKRKCLAEKEETDQSVVFPAYANR
jgi:hypothetical protein